MRPWFHQIVWWRGCILSVLSLLSAQRILAQGTFVNLGFESAVVHGEWGWPVNLSDALPGWSATIGGNPVTYAVWNSIALDSSVVGVVGTNGLYAAPAIIGRYMALIEAGYGGDTSLFQTGLVPVDANSVFFLTYPRFQNFPYPGLLLSMDGIPIPLYLIARAPNYYVWQGDVSTFAGRIAELRFTVFSSWHPEPNLAYVDAITFSSSRVPEPRTILLSSLGVLLSVLWRGGFFRSREYGIILLTQFLHQTLANARATC